MTRMRNHTRPALPRSPRLLRRLLAPLCREDGNSTVEFAICLPLFMMLFASIFELGMAMTRLTMLEHGLDKTMREIRLGTAESLTQEAVRDSVCARASILRDCEATLQVEMSRIDTTTWALPDQPAKCVDRASDINPVVTYQNGEQSDVMFIRACYVVDPIFPSFGLGAILERDHTGGLHLVASAAFSQEPN